MMKTYTKTKDFTNPSTTKDLILVLGITSVLGLFQLAQAPGAFLRGAAFGAEEVKLEQKHVKHIMKQRLTQ